MRNRSVLACLLIALVVTFAATIMLTIRAQNKQDASIDKEPATPVQEGVMSKQQREHSKLYKEYQGLGKNLHQLANEQVQMGQSGDICISTSAGTPVVTSGGKQSSPTSILEKIVAEADAIVIGTVKTKTSQLTEDGTYIFTDYNFMVEDVLKDNAAQKITPNSEIIITRQGGTILLDGHKICAVDESAKPLQIGGRYLLLLKFVPSTSAYIDSSGKGDLQIEGSKVIPLTDAYVYARFQEGRDAQTVINEFRSAIESNRQKQQDKENAK